MSWSEIKDSIEKAGAEDKPYAKLIENIGSDGSIVIRIGDTRINAHYRDTVNSLASKIYEKIKKLEEKVEGAKKALEETREKLRAIEDKLSKRQREAQFIIEEPKREWYHGFRWFYTKNGILVVAGKDAQTNDSLLRKYLETNDIILHAEIAGAAVVLIKNGLSRVKEEDIGEAAIYAASYSRAWNIGLNAIDVFMTYPDKISLHPPSGTYLKKGSFIVKKKEPIKNVALELGIGLKLNRRNNRVSITIISAPKENIKNCSDTYCVIRPGKIDKSRIAKIIRDKFIGWLKENGFGSIANKLVKIEKISELIPGNSELIETDDRNDGNNRV